MFSFALNWYFGQDRVLGYHLVNIFIHILSAVFLFFAAESLLQTPGITIKNASIRYQAALLCAVIWAVHPIQTMAVTYIVQRMASLAGLFYIMGMYLYLKFRLSYGGKQKFIYLLGYVTVFCLAMGTKENSILLPCSSLLMELIFFQKIRVHSFLKPKIILLTLLTSLFLIVIVWVYAGSDIQGLLIGNITRRYTPLERLLTESRVICLYLYQIFYPIASQFSIEHDVTLSTSIFTPITTIPAILFIFLLGGTGIAALKKYPLIAFAIFFFFLNHMVESTILNLEIIFEHRNYVPSMFLFLPFTLVFASFLSEYNKTKKILAIIICFLSALILSVFSFGTYIKNRDWKTEKSLWENAIEKAPTRARPYQNLAVFYYQNRGDWEKADELHKKALTLDDSKPRQARMVGYDNLSLGALQKNEIETAVAYSQRSVEEHPGFNVVSNYLHTLVITNKINRAVQTVDKYLLNKALNIKTMNTRTMVYLKAQKVELAYKSALEAIQKDPYHLDAITFFGYANLVKKNNDKAAYYLKKAILQNSPNTLYIYIALLQRSMDLQDRDETQSLSQTLIKTFTMAQIKAALAKIKAAPYPIVPISVTVIGKQMAQTFEKEIKGFNN